MRDEICTFDDLIKDSQNFHDGYEKKQPNSHNQFSTYRIYKEYMTWIYACSKCCKWINPKVEDL